MAESSSSKLETLAAMFAEQGWDSDSLAQVLRDSNDDVEVAVDAVLAAGSPVNWSAQRVRAEQQQPAPAPSQQQQPQAEPQVEGLSVVVPEGSRAGGTLRLTHHGRSFLVDVPAGVGPGDRFVATLPTGPPPSASGTTVQQAPNGRRVVELPEDFLRLPRSREEREQTDHEMAMILQQEAYLEQDLRADQRAAQARNDQRRRANLLAQQPRNAPDQPSVTAMFASVGDSMRAGFNSAAKNLKAATNKLTSSRNAADDSSSSSAAGTTQYGRLDLGEELATQEESPLHDGSLELPATSSDDRPPPPDYSDYTAAQNTQSQNNRTTTAAGEPLNTISL